MKAIHLIKYGNSNSAFEVREIPIPEPASNEVLIKVEAFGLNFADVIARRGMYPDAPKNPAVLGYDVAGTIEKVGSDVTKFSVGDRVSALTRFGGYAEYATTMAEGVARIPENMDIDSSTALATQACTAYYCGEYCVNINAGDNVLIQAASGGVGSVLVQIAKHHGAFVFGTASTGKIEHLRNIGVDHPIDYTKENFSEVIKNKLGGNKLDYVFDSIGGKAFKKGWKLLQPGGAMVNYGAASQLDGNKIQALGVVFKFGIFSPIQLLMSSKSMIAVNMLRIADYKPKVFEKVFSGVMDMVSKGIIKPVADKVFSSDQIAEAHNYLESRKSKGKVVVRW